MKSTYTDNLVFAIRAACTMYKLQDDLTGAMIDDAPNVNEADFDRELEKLDEYRDTLVSLIEKVPGIDHSTALRMTMCLPYREKLYKLCGL